MTKTTASYEQAFLDELDKKLWNAAIRLCSNLDDDVHNTRIT